MSEEARALAYRIQEARRAGVIAARRAALRGSGVAYMALWARWAPVRAIDAAGVPRQDMNQRGMTDDRSEEAHD